MKNMLREPIDVESMELIDHLDIVSEQDLIDLKAGDQAKFRSLT